jgi:hypothetical protein
VNGSETNLVKGIKINSCDGNNNKNLSVERKKEKTERKKKKKKLAGFESF